MEGLKLVLSGPSGSGKGTIVQELLKSDNFKLSISATTRNKREGEIHGVHYFYKSKTEFEEMIKNDELIEYAHFCDNYYGTPKVFINEVVKEGFDIILEIEVQGALQVKRRYPDAIFIFIMAPTFKELKERLISRNTEVPEVVEKRLKRAREELLLFKEYDYIVINDNLEEAIEQIKYITKSEKLKSKHYKEHIQLMLEN
ncbi:guanylate kinase [Candidatus Epulonipiscium fishelsonii]|uniref:Guanylate kinase n=1 Tax=Candidatus Epulonipiscium fishelsonii TaxID=77094 RepID=A0ACC8XHH2_9FIRM|nr:guanylate kinase [Epulopiscium sp. SCG-D08WGA-EpuloA1]OON96241.1 MAG: guanylate kinase [Epulopiscium sp. AS2M-Bin002]